MITLMFLKSNHNSVHDPTQEPQTAESEQQRAGNRQGSAVSEKKGGQGQSNGMFPGVVAGQTPAAGMQGFDGANGMFPNISNMDMNQMMLAYQNGMMNPMAGFASMMRECLSKFA
jgi:hypothetical protein